MAAIDFPSSPSLNQTHTANGRTWRWDGSTWRSVALPLTSGDITTALGFTPYSSTNPAGYITGSALAPYLTSAAAASTYQPIGSYLTGITSLLVTTALGFTPYSAANPSGFTSNVGTVTSVGVSVPTGLSVSASPVTTSGTIAIGLATGYSIPTTASQANWDTAYADRNKWDGGSTGLVAATARTSLGLVIGTNVQAWDADLDAIAALAGTSGFLKKTAANTWALDTSTYLTANQTITVTGDATGSGTTSLALTLANSGVTAGTYTKVTVDAKGRVTVGASLASADLPTYTGSLTSSQVTTALGFTPLSNATSYLPLAGGTLTGNLAFNGTGLRITGDFSNGTVASRTLFQTSTANSNTFVTAIPNGTAVNSQFQAYNSSDPANSSIAALVASASQVRIVSGYIGTGALNPITFIFSNTEAARFTPSTLNFLIGTSTDDGVNKLQVSGSVSATQFNGSGAGLTGTAASLTAGAVSSITSAQVTTALGFTPYNSTNPSGYITSSALSSYLALSGGTMTGNLVSTSGMTAWNTTTPGLSVGNYHIGTSSGTGSSGGAITFGARDASSGSNAQAGIYIISDGTFGTKMYLATTDSYATGAKTAVSIDHLGNVNIVRGALTQGGNQVLHAGNYTSYSPSLTGSGASGTWSINVTGSAGSVSGLTLTSSANGINPDTVTQNQIGYNNSVSLFGQTDGGLYSSAYSSAWVHQIFGDFRTGQIAIRGKNSGTWQSWRTVLDSSNYSSYALPLSGGTVTGKVALTNGGVGVGASSTLNVSGDITSSRGANQGVIYLGTNGTSYLYADGSGNYILGGGSTTLSVAGNQVLHAGNFTSYAVGSGYYYNGANGPLGKRRLRILSTDGTSLNSSIAAAECGFTYGGSGEPSGPFIAFGGLNGTIDYSCQLVGQYNNGGNQFVIRTRNDDAGAWNAWRTIITDGNYTSYSPSLTGSGASGTWGINVTGSSGSCSGNAATVTTVTTSQVTTATAGASVGAVGTYAFLYMSSRVTTAAGSTLAGSSLVYASAYGDNNSTSPSGTWRLMGYSANGNPNASSLWLRIS